MKAPRTPKKPVKFIITIPPSDDLDHDERALVPPGRDPIVLRIALHKSDLRYFIGDAGAADFEAHVGTIVGDGSNLPMLMTVQEAAAVLRVQDPAAVYARVARGQLAGVVRHGRRLQFNRDEFLAAALKGDAR